ncbi:hypothetical protein KIN20_023842 [Parelaphostrongylus tenuis]|uniref:beta-N-acetylhexosaminidase n=1 Tax=Parelaphostrongylus tenuis TaxID=148309 RepID=A0AAD5QT76_PARTN|nr:hypothetical protein KIN20_023842 [Parelaphostrongylus tenuis]
MFSPRWLGTRNWLWIVALIVVLVFINFSLRLDSSISSGVFRQNSVGAGPFDRRPFTQTIVHLDLKGAPPILSVYTWLFSLLRKLGVHGVLIEYEDMFPYSGHLDTVMRPHHYNVSDIAEINKIAEMNNLEVIPLVQTFGHMEFILKHPPFADLRENPLEVDTICPSDKRSIDLIRNVITQVHVLHPESKRIHIGADEAFHIAEDDRCLIRLAKMGEKDERRALERLKLAHIARVAQLAREVGFSEVFAWNDMFDKSEVVDMRAAGLGDLITPVVWGYKVDVTEEGYFPDHLFERLQQVFANIFFASAFKGANSKDENFIDIDRYLQNQMSYVKLYRENHKALEGRVGGIILTGWQRYNHFAPLCELLAISIPSLITDLVYLNDVTLRRDEMWSTVKRLLKCPTRLEPSRTSVVIGNFTYFPHKDAFLKRCGFEGKNLFKLIMEDLHLLEWKARRITQLPVENGTLIKEISIFSKKVSEDLAKYYFPEDINEFLNTKIFTLAKSYLQLITS